MPTAKFGGALDFTRCQGSQKYEVLFVCVCLSVVLLLAKFFAQKLQKFVFFQCNFFDHRGLKVVYRRYSAFCFITGITDDEVRLYVHHYIFIATVLMFILKSVDICRVLPHM